MTGLDARLADALAGDADIVPLVVGGCGSGRTTACLSLRERLGRPRAQYVDLERAATTPERFLHALISHSPFVTASGQLPGVPASPREAYDEALQFLATARTREGGPATFLLDEILELRTFESFPGLRDAPIEFAQALDHSPNHFVLTTRYPTRAARLAEDAGSRRLTAWPVAAMTVEGVSAHLQRTCTDPRDGETSDPELARLVHALGAGRPLYVDALARQMGPLAGTSACDPLSALAALLAPGGRLDLECRYRYEMRLQRARGYGALRAILAVLAEEEPLTLTPIARHLHRTAGSTKDYLTWLGDVDLVAVDRKRYTYRDPLLRVWVRLQGRPVPPEPEQVSAEVHRYALERLATLAASPAPATPGASSDALAPVGAAPARTQRAWKDMEID